MLTAARAELVQNARGVRRRGMRWPVTGLRWSLAATGGLAVALVGVLAVGGLNDNKPPAGTEVPGTEASQFLQLAAFAAQDKPALEARPDQFVFIESVTAYGMTELGASGKTTRVPAVPTTRQIWLSVDGTKDGLLREKPRSEPGKPEERSLDGCRNGPACQPAFRTDLPTTADAMFNWLYQNSQGDNPADAQAFITVGDLVQEAYLPPASLSALFSAASRIPGVVVDKDAVDVSGRHGIGVKMPGGSAELIFDSHTYEYIGEHQDVAHEVNGSARIRLAIVDRAGQLP
jgi:hypothetical protein